MFFLKDPIAEWVEGSKWLVFILLLGISGILMRFAEKYSLVGSIVRIVCASVAGYLLYNLFFTNLVAYLLPSFAGIRPAALILTLLTLWFFEVHREHTPILNLITGIDQYDFAAETGTKRYQYYYRAATAYNALVDLMNEKHTYLPLDDLRPDIQFLLDEYKNIGDVNNRILQKNKIRKLASRYRLVMRKLEKRRKEILAKAQPQKAQKKAGRWDSIWSSVKSFWSERMSGKQEKKEGGSRMNASTSSPEYLSFFSGCSTKEQIQSRYRNLAKIYHPDCATGDAAMFERVKDEYDQLVKQY